MTRIAFLARGSMGTAMATRLSAAAAGLADADYGNHARHYVIR